jgi:pimeloyl-ACP methyl ester carboxylesterase
VLRDLVGDDKRSYAGVSYGSYLGVTYANLFPGRVRALVVDGVLDPVAWSTGRNAAEGLLVPFSTRLRSAASAQATPQEFFRLCDAGGPRCAFSGGAAARFAALARKLAREPVEVTYEDGFTQTIDSTILIAITLGFMDDSAAWPDFAGFLAFVEAVDASSRIAGTVGRPTVERRPHYGIEEEYMNFPEGFPGVACSDSINPRSCLAWSVNGALADAQFGYFGRLWTWGSSICAEWPGHDEDRYLGPWNRVTANPVLVVGNRWDPAT